MVLRINTRDGAVGINSDFRDEGYLTIRKQNFFNPRFQPGGGVYRYGVSDNGFKDGNNVWNKLIIKADGDMMLYHGAYYCTSDSRVKKDIQELRATTAVEAISKIVLLSFGI